MLQSSCDNRSVFCCIFGLFLLNFFVLSPLVSPYFLLFHAILESQNGPPNEVTGILAVTSFCPQCVSCPKAAPQEE